MTTKDIKFYETLFDFVRTNYMNKPDSVKQFFKYCAEYDFATAVQMWELFFTINEKEIASSRQYSRIMSSDIFYILYSKNEQRALKTVIDNNVLTRALFMYSPDGLDDTLNKVLVDFILNNKLTSADEILKNLVRNTMCEKSFGELMKIMIEKLLLEFLKKVGGGRAVINKKQSAFLFDYISKIKGPEKALLNQRIKEIS